MKKILTFTILAMFVAMLSVHASETVLWEGSYTDGIEINSESVATLKAGDVLRVYVSVPEGGGNFKIVYKGSANNWAETTIPSIDNQWPWVNGGETYKEFTLTEADIAALSGMNIYIYKGESSTISKVVIKTYDVQTPQETSGSTDSLFNERGIADLSKIEVQNAEKVTYNAETHTVTTTEGWTGIQLTVSDGEEVSGQELRITFADKTQVKAYVKYADETDKDTIMAEAAEVLYFPLDGTKKVYQIQLQPTEVTTFVINEIAVNQESTKPVLKPLADGETRTLFESEDGVELTWNEIASMDEKWGSIIEVGEHLYVTVKSRKAEEEWPNVVLRDATSTAIGDGILLNEVEVFPYVVKMVLTDEMVAKMRQGFRFSGTGITVTKIVIYKPEPAKEGDITIDALNFFRDGSYNPETYTVTTTARRGEAGWQIGDERYADKTLVIIDFETTNFPVTLKMEYTNTEGTRLATSAGVAAGKTEVQLALPLDVKTIDKVYLTYAEPASLVLTDASVIAAANARPLTGEPIATAIRELTIDRQESHVYNLKGLRVFNNNKGLLIQQGKKILVK